MDNLIVLFPQTSLREAPGEKSRETGVLKQGRVVVELSQVSDFESLVSVGGRMYQAPWVKVRTPGNQTGWVFAGAVRPLPPPGLPDTTGYHASWLETKRLQCYFGLEFPIRLTLWGNDLGAAKEDAQLASVYREALSLRDFMVKTLAARPEPNEADRQPDFFWLGHAVPGFVFQRISGGTRPYLFNDYRYWLRFARGTKGGQDDGFFETCAAAFPRDSIESPFPVWKFQYAEDKAASRLGSGIHREMLLRIREAMASAPLCKTELNALKEALLEDVLDPATEYWLSQEAILQEMDQLLALPPDVLDAPTKTALQSRRAILEQPEQSGIKMNLRGGAAE
jgi:hypothetical protein